MLRRVSLIAIVGIAAAAQIAPPRVGYIVDGSGGLRPVTGLAGAFVVGPAVDTDVISAAYSGKTLVIKKQAVLFVNGAPFDAPAGPAEMHFEAKGILSQVFFPDVSLLWTWRNGKFDESYASRSDRAVFAVEEDEVSISGARMRFPSRVQRVSQLGENWWSVYTEGAIYAVRDDKAFELPEGDQ